MQKLKSKLFDVLARNISIESFEQWLYSDQDILNAIESDEFVLELVNRDYSNKHIFVDLEKLCFENYSFEEFVVFLVENSCEKLYKSTTFDSIRSLQNVFCKFRTKIWDYQLLFDFIYLEYDTYFESKENYMLRVKNLAKEILCLLRGKSNEDKIQLIKKSIPIEYLYSNEKLVTNERTKGNVTIVEKEEVAIYKTQKKKRKWFEFWK